MSDPSAFWYPSILEAANSTLGNLMESRGLIIISQSTRLPETQIEGEELTYCNTLDWNLQIWISTLHFSGFTDPFKDLIRSIRESKAS